MFDPEIKTLKSLNIYLLKLVEGKLWLKVIIAHFLGVGLGLLLNPQNDWIRKSTIEVMGNWLALPGILFLKLVQIITIPFIAASFITGIASNNKETLKKLGRGAFIYFLFTTSISVGIGAPLANTFKTGEYMHQQSIDEHSELVATSGHNKGLSFGFDKIPEAISSLLPDNPLASIMSVEMLIIVIINGVERLLGMFRTAVSVTGDLTACVVFDQFYGNRSSSISKLKTTTS